MSPVDRQFEEGELWFGDCLTRLAALGPRFDLAYLDPPFNAGGTRRARVGTGERVSGTPAYVDAFGGLDAFLEFLEPRLALCRAALTPEGSLWLHLDHRAVHDSKLLCDRVFGRAAYRSEVIWVPGNGGRRRSGPSVTHQTILVYARGSDMLYNADDPALREPYAELSRAMHFRNADEQGRKYRERVIGGKAYRYYEDKGRRLGSVWSDCPAMRANTPLTQETTGYPTQKPLSLLRRIVAAASRPGGQVLDPMCGSGTTLMAARELGRRFVGIDRSETAFGIASRRLAGEPQLPVEHPALCTDEPAD